MYIEYFPLGREPERWDGSVRTFVHILLPIYQASAKVDTAAGDALGRMVILDASEDELEYLEKSGAMPSGIESLLRGDGMDPSADAAERESVAARRRAECVVERYTRSKR